MRGQRDEGLQLEGSPTDDQKNRLEDFLAELTFISRQYGIVVRDPDESLELIDRSNGRMIGLGLATFDAADRLGSYDPVDSILDGVWLVDTDEGPQEQRQVGNTFPLRDAP